MSKYNKTNTPVGISYHGPFAAYECWDDLIHGGVSKQVLQLLTVAELKKVRTEGRIALREATKALKQVERTIEKKRKR